MIKIAICDDDQASIEKIETLVKEYQKQNFLDIHVENHLTGKSLLASDVESIQILFLDIEVGDENGIDIAKNVREINKNLLLIFVSGYIQYAPAGYNVKAFAYLLKNSLEAMFNDTMKNELEELSFQMECYRAIIDNIDVKIPINKIIYMESLNKITIFHTIGMKEKRYRIKTPIGAVSSELEDKGFLQMHRSYAVNLQHVTEMKNYKVVLTDNIELSVNQRKWAEVFDKYVQWKGKM